MSKESAKYFPKINATRRSLLIKFNSPVEEEIFHIYLKECVTVSTNYLVDDVPGRDFVGLRIRNIVNVEDKVVDISLRRRDQLKSDVVWAVQGKLIQSNARFGLSDRLVVHLDHTGNGRVRTKERSLVMMSVIKTIIVTVKAALKCLALHLLSQ